MPHHLERHAGGQFVLVAAPHVTGHLRGPFGKRLTGRARAGIVVQFDQCAVAHAVRPSVCGQLFVYHGVNQ